MHIPSCGQHKVFVQQKQLVTIITGANCDTPPLSYRPAAITYTHKQLNNIYHTKESQTRFILYSTNFNLRGNHPRA